jgi:hypothetical protein
MGSEWHIAGTGDFNGDGNSDILWESTAGTANVWTMNGTQLVSAAPVEDAQGALAQMGSEWHIVAEGDFDGDGKADVLWESDSGVETIWGLNGSSLSALYNNVGQAGSVAQMGSEWHAVGVGNFNGDKTADLVWVDTSNNVQFWDMEGDHINQIVFPNGHQGTEWQLKAVGDFTGSGVRDDLLWLRSDGAAQVWHVTGTQVTVTQPAPTGDNLLGL